MKHLQFRAPTDLAERLERRLEETGITRSEALRQALDDWLSSTAPKKGKNLRTPAFPPGPRVHRVHANFTAEELEHVHWLCKIWGFLPSVLVRRAALRQRLPKGTDDYVLHHISRIGNNLNQIARFAHTHGYLELTPQLDELLSRLRQVANRLLS